MTDDPRVKFGPVFSADGSRVAYTAMEPNAEGESWDTWTVPISGGTPTRLLANAAGLSWIDPRHVLFSEIQPESTIHMGLVTATSDRRDARHIYLPAHERSMAHFSYLSPDRAWVLVVEMGPMGTFGPCRLLPFDGSSSGRKVGPAGGMPRRGVVSRPALDVLHRGCGWSRAPVAPAFSRWRPGAAQVRRRVAEEEGVAVAPDGQSLVTSVGFRQSSLWQHSPKGDRLLSSEGYASNPTLSPDGRRLYYLLRRASESGAVELRVMDLETLKSERVLPGLLGP